MLPITASGVGPVSILEMLGLIPATIAIVALVLIVVLLGYALRFHRIVEMTRLERIAIWLNTGDHGFGLLCLCCSPLLALCLIGMIGDGGV